MLNHLQAKTVTDHEPDRSYNAVKTVSGLSTIVCTVVTAIMLTSCQPQSTTESTSETSTNKTAAEVFAEDSQSVPQSESTAARIAQLQPLYVTQVQGLQRRLQAEYESLQAADASEEEEASLLNNATETSQSKTNSSINGNADANTDSKAKNDTTPSTAVNQDIGDSTNASENEINTSTEVGERDLTVLKRISLEPRKPTILTEAQIIEQYQQATSALYESVTTPLSAQHTDTLIQIATVLPQLFEDAEIANRVNAKSPALARLIVQHQVWEQIQAQQVVDMQKMKQAQKQEFDMLMAKFNETIKDYDEQIAKYEQTLQDFK